MGVGLLQISCANVMRRARCVLEGLLSSGMIWPAGEMHHRDVRCGCTTTDNLCAECRHTNATALNRHAQSDSGGWQCVILAALAAVPALQLTL